VTKWKSLQPEDESLNKIDIFGSKKNRTDASQEPLSMVRQPDTLTAKSKMITLNFAELERKRFISPLMQRCQLTEEFRRIKRPLLNNAFGSSSELVERGNLIMVTSSLPDEGKTYTSINLALSSAMELDNTVLLVDADILRPSVMQSLHIDEELGLSDYLLDGALEIPDILLKTNLPGFTVMPAGTYSPQSVELLASHRMIQLVNQLAERYKDRIVIFDAPPLLVSNEAKILASMVGQIVVVVEAGRTGQSQLMEALEGLDQNKSISLVLNKCPYADSSASYYKHYDIK